VNTNNTTKGTIYLS